MAFVNQTLINGPTETNSGQALFKSDLESNLLNNVINTFRKPKAEAKGKKWNNNSNNNNNNEQERYHTDNTPTQGNDAEFEVEDDYESEDDYAHYGANAASSFRLSPGSFSLFMNALGILLAAITTTTTMGQ